MHRLAPLSREFFWGVPTSSAVRSLFFDMFRSRLGISCLLLSFVWLLCQLAYPTSAAVDWSRIDDPAHLAAIPAELFWNLTAQDAGNIPSKVRRIDAGPKDPSGTLFSVPPDWADFDIRTKQIFPTLHVWRY